MGLFQFWGVIKTMFRAWALPRKLIEGVAMLSLSA